MIHQQEVNKEVPLERRLVRHSNSFTTMRIYYIAYDTFLRIPNTAFSICHLGGWETSLRDEGKAGALHKPRNSLLTLALIRTVSK